MQSYTNTTRMPACLLAYFSDGIKIINVSMLVDNFDV